jgi:hypothetical protein
MNQQTEQVREVKPCEMCGTPTVDQWGGYCHDCDNYFESVYYEQEIERIQLERIQLGDENAI